MLHAAVDLTNVLEGRKQTHTTADTYAGDADILYPCHLKRPGQVPLETDPGSHAHAPVVRRSRAP
jgi:hypothetical protein